MIYFIMKEGFKMTTKKTASGQTITIAKDKKNLINIIKNRIKTNGNKCDLNDIDVSQVTDMSRLFEKSTFNGDISKWDVSHVLDMHFMFSESKFNGDISNWNVSKVQDMARMFKNSQFNGDISNWNVAKKTDKTNMFKKSLLEKERKLPKWYF